MPKTTEQYEAEIKRLMQDVDIALDQTQAALQSEFKAWQKVDVLNERIKGYEAMIIARDSRFIELHAAADKLIDINNEKQSKIDELSRELAEVRKDAERYRWLRDKSGADCVCDGFWSDSKLIVDLNDVAIDEKMAESDAILADKEQA